MEMQDHVDEGLCYIIAQLRAGRANVYIDDELSHCVIIQPIIAQCIASLPPPPPPPPLHPLQGPCGSLRPILTDSEEEMSLALKCIYVCERYVQE